MEGVSLEGMLEIPEGARAIVLFAHGSGSSRHSPRNAFVARALNRAGFGTLLFDLLTPREDARGASGPRFDIDLLADRLVGATDWLVRQPEGRGLRVGYFGASTGAAAALVAAARRPKAVSAVVSRGGRPDLAGDSLPRVEAPTRLIVGEEDREVLGLNEWARARIPMCDLAVVPGATHLFEEPGTLQQAANHAASWFRKFLPSGPLRADRGNGRPRSPVKVGASTRSTGAEEARHAHTAV
jgi:pimeloyl-ACP methyl ester carboxylesterase